MELTPVRWITAVVGGCLLVFSALMVSEVKFRRTYNPFQEAGTDSVYARLIKTSRTESIRRSALLGQYHFRAIFDSVDAVARKAPADQSIRGFFDAALPPAIKTEATSMFGKAAAPQHDAAKVGIDVYFVYDTVKMVRGILLGAFYGTRLTYRLPTAAGERCTVLVRMNRFSGGPGEIQRLFRAQSSVDQLLGPCAFYRSFGLPGPGVAKWITFGGWRTATEVSWNRVPETITVPVQGSRFFPPPSNALAFLPPASLKCAGGDTAKCDQALMAVAETPTLVTPTTLLAGGSQLGQSRFSAFQFGVRGSQIVASMVRDLGRDRFEKFWTGSGTAQESFKRASGMEVGDWVQRWMATQYGSVERGPHASPLGVLAGLLLAAAAIGGALVASERKATI